MTSTEVQRVPQVPHTVQEEQPLPLDPSFFTLSDAEINFFREQTGIKDTDDIVKHISRIQEEAYEVHPYPCIRFFGFARFSISTHPAYEEVLKHGKGSNALFLDIGCCFGTDIRRLISDGFPKENIVATDIEPEFWELGHRLFNTTPDTFSVPFLCGSILDDELLDPSSPTHPSPPDLPSLKSLAPLLGHVTFIHTAQLFHLFDEPTQLALARRLASLLSPETGSMIFGHHIARTEKGIRVEAAGLGGKGANMFCHSDESWKELWDGEVCEKGTVRVDTRMERIERKGRITIEVPMYRMIWSVTREFVYSGFAAAKDCLDVLFGTPGIGL